MDNIPEMISTCVSSCRSCLGHVSEYKVGALIDQNRSPNTLCYLLVTNFKPFLQILDYLRLVESTWAYTPKHENQKLKTYKEDPFSGLPRMCLLFGLDTFFGSLASYDIFDVSGYSV